MKKRSGASLEKTRNRAGYTFVIHWAIGLIMFFGYPLVNSIWYAFNNVKIEPGRIVTKFVGMDYFRTILYEDPKYLNNLRDSLGMLFYSLPIIIALSLILAVILNQKFYGRTVFRAIFFIPVIMSTSVVMNLLNSDFITMPLFSSGESGAGIIDYKGIIENLNVPDGFSPILTFLLSNTISLIWSCGVQTILFLAGLQSIPASLYEVSKIEGANKWEEFWLITVPSLRNIISLVIIYTMIDLFADMKNKVISSAYSLMISQNFGESSAMLWFYFTIVIAVISAVYIAYQRFCVKKWE
jgi:ABC-type sugar transport system permease subunit